MHFRVLAISSSAFGAALRVIEIDEFLAVEPALANVGNLILDARLVFRRVHARGVDEDPARLGVVEERVDQRVGLSASGFLMIVMLSGTSDRLMSSVTQAEGCGRGSNHVR